MFSVNMDVGPAGVNAWSMDLAWDTDLQNSLTLDNASSTATFYNGFENPTPPPSHIGYNSLLITGVEQSSPINAGYINQVTGGTAQDLTLTISNTSFRAATTTFTVNGTAQTEIALGFFRTDGASMGNSASQFITPGFGAFRIGIVPEPGTSLLMGMGLFGLLIAGRSARMRHGVAKGLREVHDQRKLQ